MKYKVLSPIKTPDGIVKEGYLEIADGEVESLTRLGVIGEPEQIAPAAPAAPNGPAASDADTRTAAIVAAIGALDKADATLWVASGAPNTKAIAAVTGFDVSAAERDAAWAQVNTPQ